MRETAKAFRGDVKVVDGQKKVGVLTRYPSIHRCTIEDTCTARDTVARVRVSWLSGAVR